MPPARRLDRPTASRPLAEARRTGGATADQKVMELVSTASPAPDGINGSGRGVGFGMATPHEITIRTCDQHIEVALGGETLAKTDRPLLVDETGLPTRYYLPREDVRMDLLTRTEHDTTCPYKGEASYWSVEVDGELHKDVVWSYENPIPTAAEIAGLLSFYPDRVDITVSPPSP